MVVVATATIRKVDMIEGILKSARQEFELFVY
jgi:hypothetical protein